MNLPAFKHTNPIIGDSFRTIYDTVNTQILLEKFVNLLMKNGDKLKASKILYKALETLYKKNVNSVIKANKKNIDNAIKANNKNVKHGKNAKNAKNVKNANNVFNVFKGNKKNANNVKNVTKNNKKNDNNGVKANKKNKKDDNPKFSSSIKFVFAKQLLVAAIYNVKPNVQVRAVKVAGRTHQVPAVLSEKKQHALAIKWLIESASINKKRGSNLDFSECLAIQLFQALRKFGKVRQKRDALHKLAESNRASLRFRWW